MSFHAAMVVLNALAVLVVSTQTRAAEEPAKKTSRPNLVIILVDDLGYGDLSSYGAKDLATPHIDRLVTGGMKFTQFYANCPVCSPTRAALLSGKFPDRVGVPGVIRTHKKSSWGRLDEKTVLVSELLQKNGYHTAMFGKWHLGLTAPNIPTRRGFDDFYGYLGDMMDNYWTHRRHGINYMREGEKVIDPKGHATDLFTNSACKWLKEYDKKKPFFVFLSYNAPHFPIQPPPEWVKRYEKRFRKKGRRATNCAFVEHLDNGIGKFMDTLRSTGLEENTIVVFSSDNGGSINHGASNGPLSGQKQDMREGGIRVPTSVVWPGRIEPGKVSGVPFVSMDIYSTLCEAAGVKVPEDLDAVSFLPTLLGRPQKQPERDLFWVRLEGGRYRGKPYFAVRRGNWKLSQDNANQKYRLYNIKEDPKESTDQSEKQPEIAKQLRAALDAHIKECAGIPWK